MKKFEPHIDHGRVAHLLTKSSEQLDDQIVSSLHRASATALQRQRAHQHAFSLSTIGHRAHNLMPHSTHQWVAATIILAAIVVSLAGYWQQAQDKHNLDIDILTDELPIELFVDNK